MNIKQVIQSWIYFQPESNIFLSIANANPNSGATTGADFLGNNTSDPGATGKVIYSDPRNLPTAIASILNHSQNKAGFHPASDSPDVVRQKYELYIREIDANPFLHIEKNDRKSQKYESSDYNRLIDDVVSLYDGVSSQDKENIKNSIAQMAKSVFSQSKSEVWNNLFSQATIDYSNPANPILYIYYTTLYMKREDRGKDGVETRQEYTVNKAQYLILPELIRAHASSLANLDKKNIDDWMSESSTPEKQGVKLCFEVLPYNQA